MNDRPHFTALACAALVFSLSAGARMACAQSERVDELIHTALTLDPVPGNGRRIYEKHCSSCHGPKAEGRADIGTPTLAGQRQAYLIKQFADFAEQERDSQSMHGVVSREEIREPQAWVDLAAWLNRLETPATTQTGDGSLLSLGEAMYVERCATCHEEDGRGDDDGFVPSLRNQHYPYLLRQMRALSDEHRRNVEPELSRFFGSLEADEVFGLADYLSRMRGPTRDRLKMQDSGFVGD